MDRRKVQKDIAQPANREIPKRRNSQREFFSVTLYSPVPYLKIVISMYMFSHSIFYRKK